MKALLSVVLCLMLATTAFAQDQDEDEKLDESVRNFGYTSGLAHSCAMDSDKLEIERRVMNFFTEITRSLGSDSAFFYAAAFGAGAVEKVDPGNCTAIKARFEETIQSNQSAGK